MDWLVILLRLAHIVLGAMWVGMMIFTVGFLMPALRGAGPAGGAVMAGLQRRRLMTVMPLIGLGTIISGLWLMERVWGGMAGVMASTPGRTFATGGALALLAFLVGIIVMRPAMARAGALAQTMGSVQAEEERVARAAEIDRLRTRGASVGRFVALLLVLATAAMAVARYL